MAPRRQKRKSRLSRMDAALDAMTPYGFSGLRVRQAVRQLLKEYGSNKGWSVIEDCAYRELIDTILRDDEGSDEYQEFVEDKNSSKPEEEGGDVAGSSGAKTEGKNVPEPELPSAASNPVRPEVAVDAKGSTSEGATSRARPPIRSPKRVKTRSIRACYGWIKD